MVERRERRRRDGTVYAVWRARWRDETGAERSKTFDCAADARAGEGKGRRMKRGGRAAGARAGRSKRFDRAAGARAWEGKVRMMKRGGALAELDAGTETLAEFVEEWWLVYAGPDLERSTLRTSAHMWNGHGVRGRA